MNAHKTPSLSYTAKSFIQGMIHELMGKCNIPLDKLPFDQDLYDESKEVMESKYNLPSSLYPWFEKYLSVGVIIAFTSYSHLSRRHQVHVAVYTASATALDDIFYENHQQMEGFNERFVNGLSQNDPILDALAQTLLDTSQFYGRVQSNLIVSSSLDFMTSMMMDLEIRKIADLNSPSFAVYCRNMSGISTTYGMFIFPKDVGLAAYIQYLPQISTFINCTNDVFSFYKEELAGEEENFASMLAKESSITKHEAIQRIADDVAEADRIILKGLAGNRAALDSWKSFKTGYVRFHTSCRRYKLDDLFELPYAPTFTEMSQ